jgi:hypothetical protein
MIPVVPILALALATCIPLPGAATPPASVAPQRDAGGAPLVLERRARNAEPEQKAELLRLAAQRWVARGERRRAIRALDGAIEATPGDARLWRERARLYAAAGAPRTAIYDLSQAIELESTNPATYRMRAGLWRRIGAHDRATADLAMAAQAMAPATKEAAAAEPPPETARAEAGVVQPDALDAPAIAAVQLAATPTIAAPRSLLPAAPPQASGRPTGPTADLAARPARSALLASPVLDDVTLSAARRQAAAGSAPAPVPAHFASSQPLFPPTEQQRGGTPAAPDPIDAHRRRMEAAAIVERRLEAGEAMTTAMNAAPAGGNTDPNFRASTAPLPRIYRGGQIPAQMAGRVAITRGTATAVSTAPSTGSSGMGGPLLPARKPVPASFDATPADPMIERGIAAPVVSVQRGALR